MTEAAIQTKIIRNMKRAGWLVCKIIQTTKNGWPDLICHKNGMTVYIEVKRVGEVADPLQAVRHRDLLKEGVPVYVTSDKNFCL